jgi:MFS family permease
MRLGQRIRRMYYGWWVVAGLSVTELVSWGVLIYAYPVLDIAMHRQLGWSYSQLNTAYATGIAVSGGVGVPVGWWLQRHGPRALMTLGSVLTVVALLGWSLVRSLLAFFTVCLIAGLAMAMTLYEPALATTSVWFTTHRARAVLIITMVAGLASVVFAPLTAWLVDLQGWRGALGFLAVIAGSAGLPIHALVLRRGPADAGIGDSAAVGAAGEVPRAVDAGGEQPSIHWRRSFAWLAACLSLATLAKATVVVGLATYLVSRGYTLSLAAVAVGGIGLTQIAGRIALVALRGRWREQHVATAAFGAQAVAVGPLLLTAGHGVTATAAVAGFVVVFGSGCGLVEVLRGTLLPEFYGVDDYARINGLVSIFVVGARAVAPVAVGAVLAATGTLTPMLAAIAAIAVGSGAALLLADRAYRREVSGRPEMLGADRVPSRPDRPG